MKQEDPNEILIVIKSLNKDLPKQNPKAKRACILTVLKLTQIASDVINVKNVYSNDNLFEIPKWFLNFSIKK